KPPPPSSCRAGPRLRRTGVAARAPMRAPDTPMHLQPLLLLAIVCLAAIAAAEGRPATHSSPPDTRRGEGMISDYLRTETAALASRCLADVHSLADWTARREQYRQQLLEMLGLSPLPDRTDLHAIVTGRVVQPEFAVEKVQFQSRPGLYVT